MISETFKCPANYFKCRGSFCLDTQYVCDGISQCADGEDEDSCGMYWKFRNFPRIDFRK